MTSILHTLSLTASKRAGLRPNGWGGEQPASPTLSWPPARGRDRGPKEEGAQKKCKVRTQTQWVMTLNQEICSKTQGMTLFEKCSQKQDSKAFQLSLSHPGNRVIPVFSRIFIQKKITKCYAMLQNGHPSYVGLTSSVILYNQDKQRKLI